MTDEEYEAYEKSLKYVKIELPTEHMEIGKWHFMEVIVKDGKYRTYVDDVLVRDEIPKDQTKAPNDDYEA